MTRMILTSKLGQKIKTTKIRDQFSKNRVFQFLDVEAAYKTAVSPENPSPEIFPKRKETELYRKKLSYTSK